MSDAPPGRADQHIPALRLDPYATSSLLQKAIRRGEGDLAERAAIRLYRLRGKGIWRRLLVIAFEDVGIGSVESLVKTATMALDALNGMLRLEPLVIRPSKTRAGSLRPLPTLSGSISLRKKKQPCRCARLPPGEVPASNGARRPGNRAALPI